MACQEKQGGEPQIAFAHWVHIPLPPIQKGDAPSDLGKEAGVLLGTPSGPGPGLGTEQAQPGCVLGPSLSCSAVLPFKGETQVSRDPGLSLKFFTIRFFLGKTRGPGSAYMGPGHVQSRNDVSGACQLESLLRVVTVRERGFICIS